MEVGVGFAHLNWMMGFRRSFMIIEFYWWSVAGRLLHLVSGFKVSFYEEKYIVKCRLPLSTDNKCTQAFEELYTKLKDIVINGVY